MELRKFIKTAILDIVGGVEDAQSETKPGTVVPSSVSKSYRSIEYGISELQVVDFEISVQAEESAGTEAKIGVVGAIFGASVGGKSGSDSGHSSVLKFRIPVQLPKSGTPIE